MIIRAYYFLMLITFSVKGVGLSDVESFLFLIFFIPFKLNNLNFKKNFWII